MAIHGSATTKPNRDLIFNNQYRQRGFHVVETLHITAGIAQLADHGSHGSARSCGTPDSLLLMHGLLPTTGQHGGRYDPQPVTHSSE